MKQVSRRTFEISLTKIRYFYDVVSHLMMDISFEKIFDFNYERYSDFVVLNSPAENVLHVFVYFRVDDLLFFFSKILLQPTLVYCINIILMKINDEYPNPSNLRTPQTLRNYSNYYPNYSNYSKFEQKVSLNSNSNVFEQFFE